jgi:hypothetical protein
LKRAHQDKIGKSALKDPMETLLVAVHPLDVRLGGYGGEGVGETG